MDWVFLRRRASWSNQFGYSLPLQLFWPAVLSPRTFSSFGREPPSLQSHRNIKLLVTPPPWFSFHADPPIRRLNEIQYTVLLLIHKNTSGFREPPRDQARFHIHSLTTINLPSRHVSQFNRRFSSNRVCRAFNLAAAN